MNPTESTVLDALKAVVDPNTGKDLVSTKLLKNLRIDGADVSFDVELGYPAQSQLPLLRSALIAAARSLDTRLLYTEDLNHGQFYADVQVLNPFRPL